MIGIVIFSLLVNLLFILVLHRLNQTVQKAILFSEATSKRVSAIDLSIQKVEELYKLDDKIKDRLKNLEKPSVELQEFIADVANTGCGMIRINPDAIFIRGLRG